MSAARCPSTATLPARPLIIIANDSNAIAKSTSRGSIRCAARRSRVTAIMPQR